MGERFKRALDTLLNHIDYAESLEDSKENLAYSKCTDEMERFNRAMSIYQSWWKPKPKPKRRRRAS